MTTIILPKGKNRHLKMDEFIKQVKEIQALVVKPMSARGWGYFLEGENVTTKSEIDLVELPQIIVKQCTLKRCYLAPFQVARVFCPRALNFLRKCHELS